jgi:hypothetical protein
MLELEIRGWYRFQKETVKFRGQFPVMLPSLQFCCGRRIPGTEALHEITIENFSISLKAIS